MSSADAVRAHGDGELVEVCWRLDSATGSPRTVVCALYLLGDGAFQVRFGYGMRAVDEALDVWPAASIVAGRSHAAAWKRLMLQERGFQEPRSG